METSFQHSVDELTVWLKKNTPNVFHRERSQLPKSGMLALFEGNDDEEKVKIAAGLAKESGLAVQRISLSALSSKYIGETEKNLSLIFEKAANENNILFFDEADALFGKRTEVKDAHDRYANQEISYLLQRIEEYSGLAILSSKSKSNIDPALLRRLRVILSFPAEKKTR